MKDVINTYGEAVIGMCAVVVAMTMIGMSMSAYRNILLGVIGSCLGQQIKGVLMKGIIETSVYLVIFALVCFFSIDFIRINQRVSDAGEISQYIENYIEAYCGDIPDSELSEEARDKKLYVLARSVQKGGMRLTYGDVSRAGDYEYIEYTLEYPLSAAMFGYSSQHTYNGLARYFVS